MLHRLSLDARSLPGPARTFPLARVIADGAVKVNTVAVMSVGETPCVTAGTSATASRTPQSRRLPLFSAVFSYQENELIYENVELRQQRAACVSQMKAIGQKEIREGKLSDAEKSEYGRLD